MIVYLFDLKARNKRQFNALKRRFYYHLNRRHRTKLTVMTKSVWGVDERYSEEFESFFRRFAGEIEVYKIKCKEAERIGI